MKKYAILLIIGLLLFGVSGLYAGMGCTSPWQEGSNAGFDSTSVKYNVVVDSLSTPYQGKLLMSVSWKDKSGENLMIFSERGEYIINNTEDLRRAELFASCYVKRGNEYVLQWHVTDFVDSCWCDCTMDLDLNSIQVGDIDGDGIAETLFLYKLNDRCDASPVRTKLIMHSGTGRMTIQGYSELFLGPSEAETNRFREEMGLEPIEFKAIDKNFDAYPAVFKKFASAFWDKYILSEIENFEKDR